MKTAICQTLDDFLSGCLNEGEHDTFERHLVNCQECQERKSQTLAIEKMLNGHNADMTMRPQWHEHMIGTLRVSTKEPHYVDATFVEINRTRIDWRLAAAIASSVLAALMLLSISRLPFKPNDKVLLGINTIVKAPTQFDQSNPKLAQEFSLTSVRAVPGFLYARVESNEPDIEFYFVLPSAPITSNADN